MHLLEHRRVQSMSLPSELQREINKWSKKLEEKLMRITAVDDVGEEMLENIHAYQKDSQHFLKTDNLVKSFECLIWAWAFLEIATQLKHLNEKT